MVKNGMKDLGYNIVELDDCWAGYIPSPSPLSFLTPQLCPLPVLAMPRAISLPTEAASLLVRLNPWLTMFTHWVCSWELTPVPVI